MRRDEEGEVVKESEQHKRGSKQSQPPDASSSSS